MKLIRIIFALLLLPLVLTAQTTVTITNGVHTYSALTNTTVQMSGRAELWLTESNAPLTTSLVHLNSRDAWVFLPQVLPTAVVSSYLSQFRINNAIAVVDSNVRVVQFASGSVIIPYPSNLQPLETFAGPYFTGESRSFSPYTAYTSTTLGSMNRTISSFRLKRGFVATMAENENGTGVSRNFVAQDADLEISLLPGDLDDKIRFIRVFPWRWVSKKGSCDVSPSDLRAQWWYNWNINQNSTRNMEYVAIKQQPHWPGLNQNWQTRGINHLLGFNEPNNPVEDAYENLTPPGSVDDAVARWPELLGTGLRIGAPAVTDGGQGWITDFINKADAAGMRVDYVPIHYYRNYSNNDNPSGAASQLYNFLKAVYDVAKRPIWVTEFNNGANWTSGADPTYAQNAAVIQAMIRMMDETPWIERYAIYSRVEHVRQTHYDEGGLTPMGLMYRDHVAPLSHVQALPHNGTRSYSQLNLDGDSLDSSGYGNNALISGAPSYIAGPSGQALEFDGQHTKVTLPPNIATNNAFTFAAWIKWNGGPNWQRIFDFGNSTTHYMFLTPSSGNNTLRFAIRNGGSEQLIQSAALPQNSWQHVAITLSGNVARLYVNGTQVAINGSMTLNPGNFDPHMNYLGESQFAADPLFSGAMDQILIADYAVPPAQIAAMLTNMPPHFSTNLIDGGGALQGQPYTNSVASLASDPNTNDTLTYSKAAGPAWLTVGTDGSLWGTPTGADNGTNHFTIRVTDAAGASAFTLLTIAMPVITGSGTWISQSDGRWSDSSRWQNAFPANGPSFTADFSTLNILSDRTVNLDESRTIGTLRFGDVSGAQNWILTTTNESTLTLDTGSGSTPSIVVNQGAATIAVPLESQNGLAKTGGGTLILAAGNALSGTLTIDTSSTTSNEGSVRAAHPDAMMNFSDILIRNNNSGSSTLQLDGSMGAVLVPGDITASCRNVTVPTLQNVSGTNVISGIVSLQTGGSMFTAQSDDGLLVFASTSRYVGSATGGRAFIYTGDGNHLVSGPILAAENGAPIGVTKSGSGLLTLSGTNTYTNTTSITAGTVLFNGYNGSSPVIVSSGATAGGDGFLRGSITVQSGGTLAPGAPLGRLTVTNNVVLNAGSRLVLELDRSIPTSDGLRVVGNLTRGGTLMVTNTGPDLEAGDTFDLIDASSQAGLFSSVILPPLKTGLFWDTTLLNASGVISVAAMQTPQLAASLQGGTTLRMEFSTQNGVTYLLQSTTNLVAPFTWVDEQTLPGNGAVQSFERPAADEPEKYYRVMVY